MKAGWIAFGSAKAATEPKPKPRSHHYASNESKKRPVDQAQWHNSYQAQWHNSYQAQWHNSYQAQWHSSYQAHKKQKFTSSNEANMPQRIMNDDQRKDCLLFLRGLPEGYTEAQIREFYPQFAEHIIKVIQSTNGRNATLEFDSPLHLQHALLQDQPQVDGTLIRALPYIPVKVLEKLKKTLSAASNEIRNKKADARLPAVQWDAAKLRQRPVKRNLSSILGQRRRRTTNEEADEYRSENRISLYGLDVPNPCLSLKEAGFDSELITQLKQQGIKKPLPIQAQCWPVLLSGHNCIAIAQTGSGKTLAYLLPAVMHVKLQTCPRPEAKEGPTALVLVPTKELAVQAASVAWSLGTGLRISAVFGGIDNVAHAAPLVTDGVDILVAAPRRLITFLQTGILTLNCVTFLVLDEAESTLFMGIGRQVRDIVRQLRPDRQISCFCATWSRNIEKKASLLLGDDFVRIVINDMAFGAKRHATASINKAIRQNIIFLQTGKVQERIDQVAQLLKDLKMSGAKNTQCLVFVNSREVIDEAASGLREQLGEAHPVYEIHGGLSKAERGAAFTSFQEHPHAVLLATDVAARGLDIKGLPYVISMFLPSSYTVYIHRIGRTGRAGSAGESWALFDHDSDAKLAAELLEGIVRAGQEPSPELEQYG